MEITVTEQGVHKRNEQHFHIMTGEVDNQLPFYNLSFDSFDEALEVFINTMKLQVPEFFEDDEESELRMYLVNAAIESTPERPSANALIRMGPVKIGFLDCYGCLYPGMN